MDASLGFAYLSDMDTLCDKYANLTKGIEMGIANRLKKVTLVQWLIVVIFVLVMSLSVSTCSRIESNYRVYADSLTYFKNKAGDEYKAKIIAFREAAELKKANDSIASEYQKIKNQKPLVVTKTVTETRIDSVEVPTEIIKYPNHYAINWAYDETFSSENFIRFNGTTTTDSLLTSAKTTLNRLSIGTDLIVDVVSNKNDEKTLSVIARSNNPYVNVTDIQGAIIDPTKNPAIKAQFPTKRWSIGPYVGYGATVTSGSDGTKVSLGPSAGISIHYNLISW